MNLTKELEEISLNDNRAGWITCIGMQVGPLIRKELTIFLSNNQDVFA